MKEPDLLPTSKKWKLRIVCCLSGGPDIGKSESMTAFGHALAHCSRYYYEQKGQQDSCDSRMALKYKGMIVGICTAGDNQETIDLNFDFFEKQHCDIGFTAARVETNNDMCAYAQSKANGVRFVAVSKQDMNTDFARKMVEAGIVDHFVSSLQCRGYRAIFNQLGAIQ